MVPPLQPGIQAPDFQLPDAHGHAALSVREQPGKNLVLLFFPWPPGEALAQQLVAYQAKTDSLAEQNTVLIGISDGPAEALGRLATEHSIGFLLISDAGRTVARSYRAVSEDGSVLPAVFVTDETGLIHRVYEPGKYPDLPNPAMVVRAVKKMVETPRPLPAAAEDWHTGHIDAPVVIIEYADYQCGPCRQAYRLLRQVLPAYGDRVLWIHRHLPLRHSHPLAQAAAEAAEAAGAQGKFWEMHDRLFEAEGALEREQLIVYAGELGLDTGAFTADLDSQRYRDAVNQDFKAAVRAGIKLPPVLFINGLPLDGPRTEQAIRERIDSLLACSA